MAVHMHREKDSSDAIVEDVDVSIWIGYGYKVAPDVVEPTPAQVSASVAKLADTVASEGLVAPVAKRGRKPA